MNESNGINSGFIWFNVLSNFSLDVGFEIYKTILIGIIILFKTF